MKSKQNVLRIAFSLVCLNTLASSHAAQPYPYGQAYPGAMSMQQPMTNGGMPQQGMGGMPMYPGNPEYVVGVAPQGNNMILGGTVVALREVTLTAQLPGRVEFLAGREGDWFAENAMIVGLNDDVLEAKRRQAIAQLGRAETALRNQQVQYSRELWAPRSRDIGRMPGMGLPSMFDQFFTRGFGSNLGYGNPWLERQADLYGEGARIREAQSQMVQAHSGIDAIDAKLRDARTLAPFAGVVTEKFVEIGDTVQPGQPLVRIADVSKLQIQVEVPVRIIGGLQIGMQVPSRLDVGGVVQAQVAQIYPAANANRHTVSVKLDLPSGIPAGPGLYAEVLLPDSSSRPQMTPIIPEQSVRGEGSLPAVFLIGEDNKTTLRLVRLGEPMGNGFVPVLSGLKPGDRILASPPSGYRAGQPVKNGRR